MKMYKLYNNNNTMSQTQQQQQQQDQDDVFDKLSIVIEEHFKKNNTYHFRPMQIDDINIYMVLHGKYKILNVESIYIGCKVKIDGELIKQNYSLYHYKYNTIKQALQKAKEIKAEYRIYDGELVSTKSYKMLKLEEQIIPYTEDECCVVCYENTSDITECKHPICLGCREKCILQEQTDCPVCRSSNTLSFYTNRSGLINNNVYSSLKRAINSDNKKWTSDDEDSDDGDSDDAGDSDAGDSDDDSIQYLNNAQAYYGRMEREAIARREREDGEQQGEGEQRPYRMVRIDMETRIHVFNAIMTEDDDEDDEISEFLDNM